MIIVGEQEKTHGNISLRSREGGDEGSTSLEEFIARVQKEEKEKNGNQDSDNDFDPSSADNALIPFQHDNAGESNDNKSDGENISKVSPPLSRVVM